MSNKEIELTYKLKVLQQELEQEEASHKATRALLADKSKIKVTIEGAKSESMKGKGHQSFPSFSSAVCSCRFVALHAVREKICEIIRFPETFTSQQLLHHCKS